jgi:hypothetical protein
MTHQHPDFYFESACSHLRRAGAPAVAYESVALDANPPAAAGNEYRFGSGPKRSGQLETGACLKPSAYGARHADLVQSGHRSSPRARFDAAVAPLERGNIAQALFDIFAVGRALAFVSLTAIGIAAGFFILFFCEV